MSDEAGFESSMHQHDDSTTPARSVGVGGQLFWRPKGVSRAAANPFLPLRHKFK